MTLSKGFPTSKDTAILASFKDLERCATRDNSFCTCSRTEKVCREALTWSNEGPVPPSVVAFTAPNVSKASSLFRMETASATAASSFALTILRSSKALVFSAHIFWSLARNSSLSAFEASSSLLEVFLVEIASSFSPRTLSLSSKLFFILANSSSLTFVNFEWDSAAALSEARALARLDLKVSRMFFKMPTISPDCDWYVPVKGAWMKEVRLRFCLSDKKTEAAFRASLTLSFILISEALEGPWLMNFSCETREALAAV